MRVAVVGAGIIGVTTAWELADQGHEVTVLERRGSVAEETSFANAGIVAPGYVTPWSAPGMPLKVLQQFFSTHAAVRLRGGLDSAVRQWLWQWWRACKVQTYTVNRRRMQELALFSRDRLHALSQQLELEFERSQGYMLLLRGTREAAAAQSGLELLRERGLPFRWLTADEARGVEPGLNPQTPLAGAVHLPQDEVGNCRQFAHLLRQQAEKRGVQFRFGTQVRALVPGRAPRLDVLAAEDSGFTAAPDPAGRAAALQGQSLEFDAVVVCAAVDSRALLAPIGLKLPLIAVHGYSVTAPLRLQASLHAAAPLSGVMDERYKVAISRLGQRVRVAGSAEIGGRADVMDPRALSTLYKLLDDWFPGCADVSQAQAWKGARPMLPDGPPVIGRSPAPGIWLNLGHGSSGWALACGSARLLADSLGGHEPGLSLQGLGWERIAR
jgi:D-amino-acid dehydrogenase